MRVRQWEIRQKPVPVSVPMVRKSLYALSSLMSLAIDDYTGFVVLDGCIAHTRIRPYVTMVRIEKMYQVL